MATSSHKERERLYWDERGYEPPAPPTGWYAEYYTNSAMPSFERGPFVLWVDHPDWELRECERPGPRCSLYRSLQWEEGHGWQYGDAAVLNECLWEGDDPAEGFALGEVFCSVMGLL